MANNDTNTFTSKSYRAEKRTDPADGHAYTWTTLAEWYRKKGWSVEEVNSYWDTLEQHSFGRTRTKKKDILPNDHGYVAVCN